MATVLSHPSRIESILEHSPLRTSASYLGLAVLYQQKNQLGDAERIYQKALALEPDNPDAWFRLGVLYQGQSKWQEAADAFEHSLKKNPDFSQAHNNLGLVYEELGRGEEALRQYEEALRLEPENSVLRENLRLAQAQFENQDAGDLLIHEDSQGPAQVRLTSPGEMTIDVAAPIEEEPYAPRSPKRITLKNGRSIVGDIVEKDEDSLWLEVGRSMKTRLSRDEVERIEDAETHTTA